MKETHKHVFRLCLPKTKSERIIISRLLAYYESDTQAQAILNTCSAPDVLQIVKSTIEEEKDCSIRSYSDYEAILAICKSVSFENDIKSKRVNVLFPIPSDKDEQYTKKYNDNLASFVRTLHRVTLANTIVDNMPAIEMNDRERAVFYLEMSMWYNWGRRNFFCPIDWFDIQKVCENSKRFWFIPLVSANNLIDLLTHLRSLSEQHYDSHRKRAVLWIDVPEQCNEKLLDIQEFVWGMRSRDVMPLFGLSCIPEQIEYKAIFYLMDD